ncbi:hypothetical protein FXF52_03700 [Micromonospora sp. MP36]|nr:hypothetical protein [Micromonospora sp. MP36]TYC25788.1 hypothetical protein FXF52_03700 [Micromonospora sp. MP36]
MVNLPAARRHHRSRIGYTFGLLAFLGLATALALVVRNPAFSATEQLTEPLPAPEITVIGEGSAPPAETEADPGWAGKSGTGAPGADAGTSPTPDGAGGGAGEGVLAGADGTRNSTDLSRSLFYSGLLGLGISLAGLGLVCTRRRQW